MGGRRFNALFGGKEAERQHQERHHRERRDTPLEAQRLILAANQFHQRHHQYGREHSARRCQHKAPGLQGDTLRWVIGYYTPQRAVRDVDHSVQKGEQRVGDGGINHFAVQTEIRRAISQHTNDTKRQRAKQHPGSEFAPARAGAVGQQAHTRVGDGIKRTRQ